MLDRYLKYHSDINVNLSNTEGVCVHEYKLLFFSGMTINIAQTQVI